MIAVFWLNYQSREHPQLKFNALSDRVLHPFDTRLRYRIGDVDPRLNSASNKYDKLANKQRRFGTMEQVSNILFMIQMLSLQFT